MFDTVSSADRRAASPQIPMCRAGGRCWCSVRRRAKLSPRSRQVLVLQSFDRGNLILDHFTGNFRVDLDQRAGRPVNVVQVVVGPTGFVGAPEQAGRRLHPIHLRRSSQAGPHRDGRRPRGGIRAQVSAAALSRHAAPVRGRRSSDICATRHLARTRPPSRSSTIFLASIDDILQVLPETKQVFMVMGSGPLGRFWRRELETSSGDFTIG